MKNPYAVIERAIDWLEANPDHHIRHNYALDKKGNAVDPTDNRAVSFCILGRIGKEARLSQVANEFYFTTLHPLLEPLGLSHTKLHLINDSSEPAARRITALRKMVATAQKKEDTQQ